MQFQPAQFDTTVIVSTYNTPDSLEKTLWGFQAQTFRNFEIIVADDGSTEETAELIGDFRNQGLELTHLWQEDHGFRKNRILNKALKSARSPYCIFTDGDCIPRFDFVETHCRLRKKKRFLVVGSHISLPEGFHECVTREDIVSGDVFRARWLKAQGHDSRKNLFRLSAKPWAQPMLNLSTHRSAIFTGNGSSVWREDALAVNGFDERLGYGGEDKDFGFRLTALGIKSRMSKFSLISLHLDHPKPYMDLDIVAKNKLHLKKIRAEKVSWTDHGIINSDFGDDLETRRAA